MSTSSTAFRTHVVRQSSASGAAGFIGVGPTGQRDYEFDIYGGYPNANVINGLYNGASGFSLGHNGSSPHIYELKRNGTSCSVYDDDTLDGTLTGIIIKFIYSHHSRWNIVSLYRCRLGINQTIFTN